MMQLSNPSSDVQWAYQLGYDAGHVDIPARMTERLSEVCKERDEARKERDELKTKVSTELAQSDVRNIRVLAELEAARKERDDAIHALDKARAPQNSDVPRLLGLLGREFDGNTTGTITKTRVTYTDPAAFGVVEIFFATAWHRRVDCNVHKPDG